MVEAQTSRKHRKERSGEVISDKMDKTIVVRVERRFQHPKFKKIVTQYKKFYAHDENNECKVVDMVRIEETRPLSRQKRWRVLEIVTKNRGESLDVLRADVINVVSDDTDTTEEA